MVINLRSATAVNVLKEEIAARERAYAATKKEPSSTFIRADQLCALRAEVATLSRALAILEGRAS